MPRWGTAKHLGSLRSQPNGRFAPSVSLSLSLPPPLSSPPPAPPILQLSLPLPSTPTALPPALLAPAAFLSQCLSPLPPPCASYSSYSSSSLCLLLLLPPAPTASRSHLPYGSAPATSCSRCLLLLLPLPLIHAANRYCLSIPPACMLLPIPTSHI